MSGILESYLSLKITEITPSSNQYFSGRKLTNTYLTFITLETPAGGKLIVNLYVDSGFDPKKRIGYINEITYPTIGELRCLFDIKSMPKLPYTEIKTKN